MESQCQSCGSFTDRQCSFCSSLICLKCKANHEPFCEEIQKRKRRGEGPTIANVNQGDHRRGHETPIDTTRVIHIPTAAPIEVPQPAALTFEDRNKLDDLVETVAVEALAKLKDALGKV